MVLVLSEVEPNTLKKLQRLQFLNLSNNPLRKLSNETFDGLMLLTRLNLSNTKLTEIQSGTFATNYLLLSLDLSKNYIKTIDFKIMHTFPYIINVLSLEDNPIEQINSFPVLSVSSIRVSKKFTCTHSSGENLICWINGAVNCTANENALNHTASTEGATSTVLWKGFREQWIPSHWYR